jgi:IclR family transcriptional regulator, acetate operon repressor
VHEDLLRRDPHGRLLLGFGVSELFDALTDMLTPDEYLLDAVNVLNERTGETSYVGVWDGPDVVTVAVREGFRSVRVRNVALGYRSHVHLRALGRALLAFRDDDYVTAYLGRTPLDALTPHSVTDPDDLRAVLQTVRNDGVAVESEEFSLGVCCAAAPIIGGAGDVAAAICVSMPKARFDADGANIVATVKEVAGTATQVLQGQSLRRGTS